ncbi:tyrosine-type recombinase/integrase [Bosea sp. NBC_00550]|uniref:tyrosine-type recombinase/integrase n=1 Tax=Bosea sp. NBC_00550 TaxID=2969621 RepID=UPI0022329700|nr:site-specific integrase [Bosea sp. NBC_00550]UZF93010.1 site-specific integrase [Bosea sp. NBC_00550]
MAAMVLTKAKIEKAVAAGVPAGKSHLMLWDANVTGLGVKVRPSGTCSWIYSYRPRGAGRSVAARTVTLGSWPSLALDTARAAAQVHMGAVVLGKDPAIDLRQERNREKRIVSACVAEFSAFMTRRRLVNAKTITSTLSRGLVPLAAREIAEITRADIVALVEKLEVAGKPGAAQDLRRHTGALLEWSVSKGYREFNPMAGLRRPRTSRADRLDNGRRLGRALSDGEVKAVWGTTAAASPFNGLVRLALLTGLRRGELAGLRWSDIGGDRITIHAERTKMGVQHEVPITSAMRAVLQAQPRTSNPLVFVSGRREGGTKLSGWSKLLSRLIAASSVRFTLHDCRRTVRTNLSRLGVAEDTAELCIGHVRRGLLGVYNKDRAWAARVAAFETLSNYVACNVSGFAPDGLHGLALVSSASSKGGAR